MRPVSLDCISEDVISDCGQYRPWLKRTWGKGGRFLNFCMLNPSTAKKDVNDPTVYGNEVRARRWGYDGIIITNLNDVRATDPRDMLRHPIPCSAANDRYITIGADQSAMVICAWGKDGSHLKRAQYVLEHVLCEFKLHALKLNKDGSPAHPLYLGYGLEPFLWKEEQWETMK